MATDKETFLARWSRLKQEEREKLPETPEDPGPAPALPELDKLTTESDFSPFMHPKVQDALRRVALKKLFSDPHFNTPDPFEAYSGDWTGGEAIPQDMLATLNQARTLLFDEQKKEQAKAEQEPGSDSAVAEKYEDDEAGRKDA